MDSAKYGIVKENENGNNNESVELRNLTNEEDPFDTTTENDISNIDYRSNWKILKYRFIQVCGILK